MQKKLRVLPVQTDRGVFLRFEQDGVELPPVGPIADGVSFDVSVESAPSEEEPTKKKNTSRDIKRRSLRQEKRAAAGVGGKIQPGSGAIPGKKGDFVIKGEVRGECKFTYASQYSLSLDTMYKIASEAEGGEVPVVEVQFLDKKSGKPLEELVVLYRSDWEKLVNRKRK